MSQQIGSIVTVTTPAAATALTTIERIKQELDISGDTYDELLQAKIDEASSDIAERCGPLLQRQTVSETFWLQGLGRSVLSPVSSQALPEALLLGRIPVVSISSVTVDDELVDAAEYRLNDRAGMLYRLDSEGYPSTWYFTKSVVVEYVAGYLLPGEDGRTLPPALEGATIDLVVSYWRARGRDPTVRAEDNVGVSSFQYWVGAVGEAGELPPGVMAKLGPYLRSGGIV